MLAKLKLRNIKTELNLRNKIMLTKPKPRKYKPSRTTDK